MKSPRQRLANIEMNSTRLISDWRRLLEFTRCADSTLDSYIMNFSPLYLQPCILHSSVLIILLFLKVYIEKYINNSGRVLVHIINVGR